MIKHEDLNRFRRFDNQRPVRPGRRLPIQLSTDRPPIASEAPVRPARSDSAQPLRPIIHGQPPSERGNQVAAQKRQLPVLPTLIAAFVVLLLVIGTAGFIIYYGRTSANPIPASYRTAVDFPAYFPDPAKLPTGYHLDLGTFTSPAKGVILYNINYGGDRHIVVAQQNKPSDSDLKAFNSQRIPLHTTISTHAGQAVMGAIGDQDVVSLPTKTRAWIIITAPYNIDQEQLKAVLNSFKT